MSQIMHHRPSGIIGGAAALCLAAGVGACTLDTKGHLAGDAGPDDSLADDWIYEATSEDRPEDTADGFADEGPDVSEETARDMETREDLDTVAEAEGDVPGDIVPEEQADLPDADAEEPSVECGGVLVGGYCWYVSEMDRNCTDKCALHGGCNLAGTRDYAGSGGTDAQCLAVLDALGYGDYNHQSSGNNALGCQFAWGTWTYWSTDYQTTCEAVPFIGEHDPTVLRMCACER